MRNPLHGVAIVGVHNTAQARRLPGATSLGLALEAVHGALADAGLSMHDVDGMSVRAGMGYPIPEPGYKVSPYSLFGGRPVWQGTATIGIDAVLEAATAVACGLCQAVVIASGQAGTYVHREEVAPWTRPANEFVECWGLYTTAQFAMMARRHMAVYGTRPEHLAEVASAVRTAGSVNPEAAGYGRGVVTPDDVLASPMIADPFHLLDCTMPSEGGVGLVLTTVERARDLDRRAVFLLGGSQEVRQASYSRPARWEEIGWIGAAAAQRSFAMAGCGPADVDVCEFYDNFSFQVIHQFEAFGFCERGEGGPFVMNGTIREGGRHPVCTDGGTLSFSHTGEGQLLQRVVAGVHQLRGESRSVQVPGAEIALVSNQAMAMAPVLLLGTSPAERPAGGTRPGGATTTRRNDHG